MAKFLPSTANKLKKCLSLYACRSYSSEIKGSWNKPPMCKEHKKSETEPVCTPKEMSCTARLGDCNKYDEPECGQPIAHVPKYLICCCDKRLSKPPCEKSKTKKVKKPEPKPFKSMWDVGFRVENNCPDAVPRLDEKHYKPSDKRKRVYTKTWESCYDVIKNVRSCPIEEVSLLSPPFEKRCKPTPDPSVKNGGDKNVMECPVERNPNLPPLTPCPKIKMPCCRAVATSLKCHINRIQSKCMKVCCPYPSYSECDRSKVRRLAPSECRCGRIVNQCDVDSYRIRRNMYSIPPPVPAWPPKERPK